MSQPLIDALTALCFYEQEVKPVDLLFVFGSNIFQRQLGVLIGQLIDKTQVDTILITGGMARYNDLVSDSIAESERILATIAHRDRTDIQFILETTSTNTLAMSLKPKRCTTYVPIAAYCLSLIRMR